jgi:hypothetical protein
MAIGISGCSNAEFSGSKTGNDSQFLVDFDVLNTTVNHEMHLSAGEKIETAIKIKKGDVDIAVKNENGTVAYQGNDVESNTFYLEITETGTYTFYVTVAKAEGSVHFVKSLNDSTT